MDACVRGGRQGDADQCVCHGGGVFKAYACYNLVFREIGVYGRDESGNDVGSPCYADYCTIGENGDQMTQGAGQGGVWFSERTYTVSKPAGKKIALFPYIKIGGLVSGTSDYTAGNFWMWGNGWGASECCQGRSPRRLTGTA